jgi:hypothetical protein
MKFRADSGSVLSAEPSYGTATIYYGVRIVCDDGYVRTYSGHPNFGYRDELGSCGDLITL